MKKTTQKKQKPAEKEVFFAVEVLEDGDARFHGPFDSPKEAERLVFEEIKDDIELGMSSNLVIVKQVRAIRVTLDATLRVEDADISTLNLEDEDEE